MSAGERDERPDAAVAPARHDPRLPVLGAGAWLGGIGGAEVPALAVAVLAAVLGVTLVAAVRVRRTRGAAVPTASGSRRLLLATWLVAAAAVASAVLRAEAVEVSPLRDLAERRASVDLVATVASDPRPIPGRWEDQVVVRIRASEVTARGQRLRLGAPVVLLGGKEWRRVALGERVLVEGRLAPADDAGTAALVLPVRAPVVLAEADRWWRGAAAVRAAIRASVADRPIAQAVLVPALVSGDDAGLPAQVEADFRTTGLTHLTAVSGTNLTLVVGALLLAARSVGVRGRRLTVVGLLGIVAFVLLARTEPSVLRAAAMGAVGLFALGPDGRRRGLRALGAAVVALVLVQPALAVSPGFALSVLATGGIVLLGGPVAAALGRWLPSWLAQAVAVPASAQLAVTPVVAALSGEVSLVAVAANLLAGPAVGPATVLGLLAGLTGLVWPGGGEAIGTLAAWCVGWIVTVAEHGATLPGASVGWGTGSVAVGVLAVICLAAALVLPRLLARRSLGLALAVGLVVVVLGVPGRIGSSVPVLPGEPWPPRGWMIAACDVGQGDSLVVRAGPATALVVDAGPDPAAVDRCLGRLGVRQVPLLVLTHLHADHVDGLAGVLRGRDVGAIEISPVLDPPAALGPVRRAAAGAGLEVGAAPFGSIRRYGEATVQVLHPEEATPRPGPGDGSAANDASVVLLVEVAGLRVLLTGDLEPSGQAQVAARLGPIDVDVLKVPHHGSARQDADWLSALAPDIALVPVGADNDYGHPDPGVLDLLDRVGARVARTDTDGDIAVVLGDDGRPAVATRD